MSQPCEESLPPRGIEADRGEGNHKVSGCARVTENWGRGGCSGQDCAGDSGAVCDGEQQIEIWDRVALQHVLEQPQGGPLSAQPSGGVGAGAVDEVELSRDHVDAEEAVGRGGEGEVSAPLRVAVVSPAKV